MTHESLRIIIIMGSIGKPIARSPKSRGVSAEQSGLWTKAFPNRTVTWWEKDQKHNSNQVICYLLVLIFVGRSRCTYIYMYVCIIYLFIFIYSFCLLLSNTCGWLSSFPWLSPGSTPPCSPLWLLWPPVLCAASEWLQTLRMMCQIQWFIVQHEEMEYQHVI